MDSLQAARLSQQAAMLQAGPTMAAELQQRLRRLQTNCIVLLEGNNITVEATPPSSELDPASRRPMLCRVTTRDRLDDTGGVDDARIPIFTAVDSVQYRPARRATFDKKAQKALAERLEGGRVSGQSAAAWPAFLNQASYSFATRRRFYLCEPSREASNSRTTMLYSRSYPASTQTS
eukprot:2840251-Prymnesium_polylepis.1